MADIERFPTPTMVSGAIADLIGIREEVRRMRGPNSSLGN